MFRKELLTRLIICNYVVCYDMFVRLSLCCLGWVLGYDTAYSLSILLLYFVLLSQYYLEQNIVCTNKSMVIKLLTAHAYLHNYFQFY